MILAHSFPVAINMVDVAINQDMKAIKLRSNLRTAYVFNCLSALKRQILKLITTAGHGTKKFDTDMMAKLFIPVPPLQLQDKFVFVAEKIEETKSHYQQSLSDLEALYGTLSQKAFKGELDLTRVIMPRIQAEEDITMEAEPTQTPAEQTLAIHFPDTGNLLAVLKNPESRKEVISQWLEAYCNQLGNKLFKAQNFMEAVRTQFAELHPDNDFELGTNDYESIKAWVFNALANGRLKQTRNITGHDEKGETIFGNLIELQVVQV